MDIDWEKIKKEHLEDGRLYDKILSIPNEKNRQEQEKKLLECAKHFKVLTSIKSKYNSFKSKFLKEQKQQQQTIREQELMSSVIDFGEKAPIREMKAPMFYKDKMGCIRKFDNGKTTLVTSTLIQPICILRNNETNEELVKCAFLNRGKWNCFIVSREVLSHTGKITRLANKGVDVTTDSARLLVSFIRDLINNNNIPENVSTSKMGWFGNKFLPYDEGVEFDGEDAFRPIFESITSKGKFEDWRDEIHKLRIDNTVLKLVMATSFASPLLHLLHRQSFITHLWGATGGKKSVAGRIAMSIWGDNGNGKLMFKMDSTVNFYLRVAAFMNHLPCFFDELQTYTRNVNHLIMTITEGIDRGKARADGGIEGVKTWNNTFIFTGEEAASNYNSGGGTMNRLIEIYITKDIVEDGMGVCNFLADHYGTAGKVFIDYIQQISKEELNALFYEKYNQLMAYNKTEEKQAINMAMLLLADDLACKCIFKNEKPLQSKDVLPYMFTKDEIDNSQRAYEMFLDECEINNARFRADQDRGGFWGVKDDFEIAIISSQLRKILQDNGFDYKKIQKDWARKGYIQKNSAGKYSTCLSKEGHRANYTIVKIVEKKEPYQEQKKEQITENLNNITNQDLDYDDYFMNL